VAQREGQGSRLSGLLIAAVAEREQVTLLHYDSDYDVIADITNQPMQWVVPHEAFPRKRRRARRGKGVSSAGSSTQRRHVTSAARWMNMWPG